MIIKSIKGCDVHTLFVAIEEAFANSRFTAEITRPANNIKIANIRLKEKKHYCGNHPSPCPVRAFHRPHKHHKFLEGVDWVSVNDKLNDIMDELNVSAYAGSSLVSIRKGKKRCYLYGEKPQGIGFEWVKNSGYFADMTSQPHQASKYPEGTPGVYQWE